jgi:hypothetical protein
MSRNAMLWVLVAVLMAVFWLPTVVLTYMMLLTGGGVSSGQWVAAAMLMVIGIVPILETLDKASSYSNSERR